ncbi:pyridoxal phosphate-dependent transferase [Cokeromyces recurvatus]|uniref:pyridoxal phosphate-dependent transferase n=1 Tax=Cokeromyces recurvatus TaxID=90255 RepID=UPI00221F4EDD|nr:pyridoxal phosphate-dependent transferase [Cokeromyces recurvatus]KAI7908236.1 pyridoxal phosphate-dependent transferase [Cokeromyces recurvatus]
MAKVKQQLLDYSRQQRKNGSYLFLETAGGIHSPVMSGTPQADFYRPLRLPTLLIGDSNLGGISTTLTSFESLRLRGYDIPIILLFNRPNYKNHVLIGERVKKNGVLQVATIPPPPQPIEDPISEEESMKRYYTQVDECLVPVIEQLDTAHQARFDRLETMAQKSRDILWWPFTQHKLVKDVTVIDSAYNDYFTTYPTDGTAKEMFDSCASWWTQGLGHANPDLTLSAAYAAGRYGHVIFPEATNEPALSLAETVLQNDNWASRVFFSDNGSTAMEVALKMAMSATAKRYGFSTKEPVEILGIDGSYHGDTIGAMDACAPNVYNEQVQWYHPKGHWLKPPSVHISQGHAYVRLPSEIKGESCKVYYDSIDDIYSVDGKGRLRDDKSLAEIYGRYIRTQLKSLRDQGRRIGSLLMEPVLMGAGGMIFVDPLFQRVLIDIVRQEGSQLLYGVTERNNNNKSNNDSWQGLPIVFDEVFAGWYRLGRRSASEFLGVTPDITAYAKTLTGGLLPLALTVTKESIYDVFLSHNKPDCLLHGHSYTAHPMGCSVAKTSIESLNTMAAAKTGAWAPFCQNWEKSQHHSIWSMWSPQTVDQLSKLNRVESVMTLGSVLAVELKDDERKGYGSNVSKSIIENLRFGQFKNGFDGSSETGINLFARPLGNIIYLMTSQITTPDRVHQCEQALLETLAN